MDRVQIGGTAAKPWRSGERRAGRAWPPWAWASAAAMAGIALWAAFAALTPGGARGAALMGASALVCALAGWALERNRGRARRDGALSRAEEALAALPDLFFEVDASGRILDYRSPDTAQLYVPKEVFLGRLVTEVLPPKPGQIILETVRRAAFQSGVERANYELEIGGELRTFELRAVRRASCVPGPDAVCITLARDITEQVRAQAALSQEQARLGAFVEHAPAAIAMFDAELRYLAISRRWREEYHLGEAPVIGRSHYEVFPNIPERWKAIHRRVLGGSVERCEHDIWRPPGWQRDQHLRWEVRPWHLSSGALGGLMMFTQDITLQAEQAQELKRLGAAAQAASQAKSEFLANMSHEIRTPLTTILGFAELMLADVEEGAVPDREELRVGLSTVQRAGRHLQSVISDILDLSKIEAGKLTAEHAPTCVLQLVEDLDAMFRARALAKGIALLWERDPKVPTCIRSDPTRLRQILVNLIGNAVKFTDSGHVRVRLSCDSTASRLRVDVIDTGPGIAPNLANRLFEPFTQADSSASRVHGGTGLGLTISRRLARLLDGDVEMVDRGGGSGAHMRLDLPLVPATPDQSTALQRTLLRTSDGTGSASVPALPGRILLVEDGVDTQALVRRILERAGYEVLTASDGLEAQDLLKSAESGRIDLVLTDLQMPRMDGYELVRALRASGSQLPIVALSAHAMAEDRARSLATGCDDYLSKPIDRVSLLATAARWIRTSGANAPQSAST